MPRLAAIALAILAAAMPAQAAPISATARKEADTLYQTAYAAYVAADYRRALSTLDAAEAIKPDFADCLNLRGIICMKEGEYDKAETAFSKAVSLDPNLWAAQFNLGEIPYRRKDFGAARIRFEKLLSHTNRFKDGNKWELVQYKSYLCTLLSGDADGAQKKLERLPAKDGATPAYQYAQAALCLSKKDPAGAAKWLTTAQSSYNVTLNSLFADSLGVAGWSSALPGAALALARPGVDPRRSQSASAYLDPRLEAAAAEPLPAPDGGILPMLPMANHPAFSLLPERSTPAQREPAPENYPPLPDPTPVPRMSGLDDGGLLMRD